MTDLPTPDSLRADLSVALKQGDKRRVAVIRGLLTSLRVADVSGRGDLTKEDVLQVISKEVRQRQDSAEQFRAGGRGDRATEEEAEAEILKQWLPAPLPMDELAAMVDEAISNLGASGPQDTGKVMGELMPRVRGRADGKVVSVLVRNKLAAGR